jgi:hypothetical protein
MDRDLEFEVLENNFGCYDLDYVLSSSENEFLREIGKNSLREVIYDSLDSQDYEDGWIYKREI